MKSRSAARLGQDIVLTGHLTMTRDRTGRRPMLRLVGRDPVTFREVFAETRDLPSDGDFMLEIEDPAIVAAYDGRSVYLATDPEDWARCRRVVSDYRAAVRRWTAEQKAAGRLVPAPRFADPDPGVLVQPWTTFDTFCPPLVPGSAQP